MCVPDIMNWKKHSADSNANSDQAFWYAWHADWALEKAEPIPDKVLEKRKAALEALRKLQNVESRLMNEQLPTAGKVSSPAPKETSN